MPKGILVSSGALEFPREFQASKVRSQLMAGDCKARGDFPLHVNNACSPPSSSKYSDCVQVSHLIFCKYNLDSIQVSR